MTADRSFVDRFERLVDESAGRLLALSERHPTTSAEATLAFFMRDYVAPLEHHLRQIV